MKPVRTSRIVDAQRGLVFRVVSDIRNFQDAIPHITSVEFLSEQRTGVGTRFRETRLMNGREVSTELEIVEYEENERVRLVSDTGGTIWDTEFAVSDAPGGVEMKMQMDIRPHTIVSKLMTPFIRGMVAKSIEADMDAVKEYCESEDRREEDHALRHTNN